MIAAKYKILHPKYLVLIFFIMLGLSFASVPLYDLFCRVTGFGGTPQVTKKLPTIVASQLVTMRFDANAAGNLPVRFQVKNNKIDLRPGEIKNVIFQVSNEVNQDLKVVATFNVTPDSVGKYFNKLECFCFEQQKLAGNEVKELAVSYYIDPAIVKDPATKNVKDITLSYTLFEVDKFRN